MIEPGALMYLKLIISAPETIKIRPDSEDTLTVTLVPAAGSYFIAKVKGSSPLKTCRVAGDVKPTECKLTDLRPATEYTLKHRLVRNQPVVVTPTPAVKLRRQKE